MPATELGEHLVAAPDSPISHNRFEAGVYHAKDTNAQREIQTALLGDDETLKAEEQTDG